MTINHLLSSQVRAGGIQRPKGEGDSKVKKESGETPTRGRADTVEISPEARVLASADPGEVQGGEALSAERIAEIRQRVDDGTYDSPEVAEEVARQILNSGDLDS